MPASIVTQLKVDDKELKSKLQAIEKYTKETYGQWLNSTAELNKKTKELAKQQEQLARATKSLNAEKAKGDKSDAKKLARYERFIKLNKETIKQTRLEATAIRTKTNAQKAEIRQMDEVTASKKKVSKATSSLTNDVVRHLRQIETLVIAYYTLSAGFSNTIGIGLKVNKMIEDNTSGIAALLSANTQMVLSNGEIVNSYEKFRIGQQIAAETMEDLRTAAIKTYATFPQLTEVFQQAIGQTLSMGDAFGSTVDEITSNTVKLSQRMTNIAGAIGMPMDRAKEEIRSLLSGNASTDSLISTMIFGSPGEANKAIRMAKDRGKDGLTQLLNSVLEPFDVLEGVDSYTRSLLQLEDAWSQTMATMSEPVFDDLKVVFKDLATDINTNKESIAEGFSNFYEGAKDIAGILDEVAVAATAFYGAKAVAAVYAMVKAQKALNLAILANPYVLGAAAAVGVYEAATNWEALGDTILDVADVIADVADDALGTNLADNVDYNRERFNDFKGSIEATEEALKKISGTIEGTEYKPFDIGISVEDILKGYEDTKSALASTTKDLETSTDLAGFGNISGNTNEVKDLTEAYKNLTKSVVAMKEAQRATLVTKHSLDMDLVEKAEKELAKPDSKIQGLKDEIKEYGIALENFEDAYVDMTTKIGKDEIGGSILTIGSAIEAKTTEISQLELEATQKLLKLKQDLWVATQRANGVEVTAVEVAQWKITALEAQLAVEDDINSRLILRRKIQDQIYKRDKATDKEVKKNLIKIGDALSAQMASTITNAIQAGFDGDFDFDKVAGDFATAVGNAITQASIAGALEQTGIAALATTNPLVGLGIGVGAMAIGSLLGQEDDGGQSQAEIAQEEFDTFIDSLNKAGEALNVMGNSGTDIANKISEAQSKLARYQEDILQANIVVAKTKQMKEGTLSGADAAGFATTVDVEGDETYYQDVLATVPGLIDQTTQLIADTIKEDLGSALDFSLYSKEELAKITGIEDIDEFNVALLVAKKAYSDTALEIKKLQNTGEEYVGQIDDLAISMASMKDETTDILVINENYSDAIELMGDTTTNVTDTMEENISSLESVFESLQNTIDSLRGAAGGSAYTLDLYNQSMKETQALLARGDTEGFIESLSKTQGLTSVLMDQSAFEEYGRTADLQQRFAQSVAANQFEAMQTDVQTEIDILKLIEKNTRIPAETIVSNQGAFVNTGNARPSFAVGTTNVTSDMVANIHRGEIIVPKDFSDGIRSGDVSIGSNRDQTVAIKEQNKRLEDILLEIRDIQQANLDIVAEETA